MVRKTSGRFGDSADVIISIEGEPFLGRDEELKSLKEFLLRRRNVLVEAPRGMGKTMLLRAFQQLYANEFEILYVKKSKDFKPALLEIISGAGALKPGNATIPELQGMVNTLFQELQKKKQVILLLDHLEDGYLKTEELLRFLEENNICFAGAASDLKKRLHRHFKERIKLDALKEEEASKLVKVEIEQKFNIDAPESFITTVLRKSNRVPFFIKDILKEVETQNQLQEFDFKSNPERASQVVERMAPHPMLSETEEKIDILPVWTVFIIAYLFLAFRYIAMGARDYEMFIVAGALGYLLRVVGMSLKPKKS
jgi:type II secretory pathway predicted ATPase ExeA